MREPKKKSKSHKMFEAVFDQQTRRFSAFDLLGLSVESPTKLNVAPSDQSFLQKKTRELKKQEKEKHPRYDRRFVSKTSKRTQKLLPEQSDLPGLLETHGTDRTPSASVLEQDIPSDDEAQPSPPPHLLEQNSQNLEETDTSLSSKVTGIEKLERTDYRIQEDRENLSLEGEKRGDKNTAKGQDSLNDLRQLLGTDGLFLAQTVDPQCSGQTPPYNMGQTPPSHSGLSLVKKSTSELGTDGPSLVKTSDLQLPSIVLAPLQWKVWITLQESETRNKVISYRDIALINNSTIEGIRKAVSAIEKEGGILEKKIVRRPDEQGLVFKLNREIPFRKGSLSEAKAILKRGLHKGQTPDRQSGALGTDGLCMYVCNSNIYIKHTDIVRLLKLTPESWKIREQTLIQIAELLPEMTAIEFRLSLSYLVEQAKQTKGPIRNPNAWLKAAFEKNQAPLITERDIEARFGRKDRKKSDTNAQPPTPSVEATLDNELLRFYLGSSAEVRAEIDRIADLKAAPLLKVVTSEHQTGILAEARLEAVREFFSKKSEQVSE